MPASTFQETIRKYNKNHDSLGRFSSTNGANATYSAGSFVGGSGDFELTGDVRDMHLTPKAREKVLEAADRVKTAADLQDYLKEKGIEMEVASKALQSRMEDEIPAVKQLADYVIAGVEQYEEIGGLSSLKKIHFFDPDLDAQAQYSYRAKGEGPVEDEGHMYLSNHANGFQVMHEFAHAYADSTKPGDKDLVEWSAQLNEKAGLPSESGAYFGANQSVLEAERFANAMGGAFAFGNSGRTKLLGFAANVANEARSTETKKTAKPEGRAQMTTTTMEEKSRFTVYKADDDKHLVFGWASVSITVDGELLEDRQHDTIDPEDLEEAAYEYVLNFRDAGEEHLPGYRKKGKLVESCVLTQDKQRAMGIPDGILPVGWWIGFKIEDEETWQKVKNGTYKMFSIEGKANREPVEKKEAVAKRFTEILKYNKNHDPSNGRFASTGGGGGGKKDESSIVREGSYGNGLTYTAGGDTYSPGGIHGEKKFKIPPSDDPDTVKSVLVRGVSGYLGEGDEKHYVHENYNRAILDGGVVVTHNTTRFGGSGVTEIQDMINTEVQRLAGIRKEGVFYRGTNNKEEISLLESGTLRNSYNHITGQSENGVSVSDNALRSREWDYCYKVTGTVVGYGSDGEPVLDPKSMKVLGGLSKTKYYNDAIKKMQKGREKFCQKYNWTEEQLRKGTKGFSDEVKFKDVAEEI